MGEVECAFVMATPASRIVRYAPDKGSFPLDHGQNKGNVRACEELSKAYLTCRMTNGLMDKEEMENLGFNEAPADVAVKEPRKFEKHGFVAGIKHKHNKE